MSDGDNQSIPAGRWAVVSVVENGRPRDSVGAATLAIDSDGRVEGSDGCGNDLETQIDGQRLPYEGFHTTAGCIEDAANDEATLFWAVLAEGPTYEVADRKLVLRTSDGDGFDFVPAAAP